MKMPQWTNVHIYCYDTNNTETNNAGQSASVFLFNVLGALDHVSAHTFEKVEKGTGEI